MGSDPFVGYFGGRPHLGRRIRPRAGTLGPAPGLAASPPLAYKINVGSSDCSPSRPLRTTTPPESTIRAAFSTVSRSGSGSTGLEPIARRLTDADSTKYAFRPPSNPHKQSKDS